MKNMKINFPDDLHVLAFLGGGDPSASRPLIGAWIQAHIGKATFRPS